MRDKHVCKKCICYSCNINDYCFRCECCINNDRAIFDKEDCEDFKDYAEV